MVFSWYLVFLSNLVVYAICYSINILYFIILENVINITIIC